MYFRFSSLRKYSGGFTLVEMSIVLVIIGLLIGGVLAGKSMLRQSQLNSAMADVQRYITAAQNFSTKYGALPGDMPNATDYWGVAAGNTGDAGGNYTISCYNASGNGTKTCNGNGDSQIAAVNGDFTEQLLFWQHLSYAQLIQGTFTGGGSNSGTGTIPGTNAPSGKLRGSGFSVASLGVVSANSLFFDGNDGHVFYFGMMLSNAQPYGALLTTQEASGFDTKFDDGLPATGSVVTFKPAVLANCANSSASNAIYNISVSGQQCSLMFVTGF